MKKLIRIAILALCTITHTSWAGFWLIPVNVTSQLSGNTTTYDVDFMPIDIPEADQICPWGHRIYVGFQMNNNYFRARMITPCAMSKPVTVGYALNLFQGELQGRQRFSDNSITPTQCLGVVLAHYDPPAGPLPYWFTIPMGLVIPIGNTCSHAPPSRQSCDIGESDLLLDHGTLPINTYSGHKVTENITVNCTNPATLRLRLTSTAALRVGDVMSKLETNGKNILGTEGAMVTAPTGQSRIPITSTLYAGDKPPQAGVHTGSTVLVVEIM